MDYALDTNMLVRWLIGDNETQTKKVEEILSSGRRLHVSDMAIAEMVFVLAKYYDLNTEDISQCIKRIIRHKSINCNSLLFGRVIEDYGQSPKTSFVDVCLAHYAGLADAKLLTFDKTLARKLPTLTQIL